MVAAQETTLQDVLEGTKQYLVPLYQRPYQWGKDQLSQLWEDIVELADDRREGTRDTHFIGSLVLAPPPASVAGGINTALHVSECVGDRGVGFGVAQHIGVLAGTR